MLRAASAYESVTTGQARHPLPETPPTAETNHSRVISVPGALTHIAFHEARRDALAFCPEDFRRIKGEIWLYVSTSCLVYHTTYRGHYDLRYRT